MSFPVISGLPFLKSTLRPLVEFIYPPTCFACETFIKNGESRVCPSCWSTIKPVTSNDLLYQEMSHRLTEGRHISHLLSLFHFEKDGTLQSILHQLKYNGSTSLGVELGRRLGEKLRIEFPDHSIDGIVPVPLHSTKLRERGYNQSEHIAKGIREMTGIPVLPSLLRRHKYTTTQTQLSATERKENVGDAFSVNKRYLLDLEGKTFLIVDDVITTGATIEACAEVLMGSGARSIVAGSVGIADHSV